MYKRPILSSSCLLIKFATPYIAGGPALFLWESPPYHHSIAGVPAIYIPFSLAGVPAHSFLFLAGVPASYLFSHAGVPALLGLPSFQFYQFHQNLISEDEENSWSFTIIHISSQLHLIIISTQSHHNHFSQFASMHGDNSTTSIHSSIQIAHILINNSTRHNLNSTSQQHISQHSIKYKFT